MIFDPRIIEPKPQSVARYNLTIQEWWAMLERQGGVCGVCKRVPPSGKFCVDHRHVPGWKRMAPEGRRRWVRGICCRNCNGFYLAKGLTVEKALNAAAYLQRFEDSLSPAAPALEAIPEGVPLEKWLPR